MQRSTRKMKIDDGIFQFTIIPPSLHMLQQPSTSAIDPSRMQEYVQKMDIGVAVRKKQDNQTLTDDEKFNFLTRSWKPPEGYNMPIIETIRKGKSRLTHYQLERHHCFRLSELEDGIFCCYCVLFQDGDKAGNTKLGRFVLTPYKDYHHFGDRAKRHIKSAYHRKNAEKAQIFLGSFWSQGFDLETD